MSLNNVADKMVASFNAAIEGFIYVIKTQRNMRIHFLIALLAILLGVYLNFTRIDLMILCLTAGLVLITEMVNTAIEIVLNHTNASRSSWVRTVKDISAGSVLVASINAVIIGYFLFFKNNLIYQGSKRWMFKIGRSDWHISFFILILLIGLVIAGKAFFNTGKPLRGGMPSGHSAVAFSLCTLIALITQNPLVVFAVLILAVMIAQSRIARHYHSLWEVLIGASLGVAVTITVFRLLVG